MILVSHAIIGGALGRLSGNPLAAFFIGFASHFVMDAIPHSHYLLSSVEHHPEHLLDNKIRTRGLTFFIDLLKIGTDGMAGIVLSVVLFGGGAGFSTFDYSILTGAIGGMLPDGLKFIYWKIRTEPFLTLEKFHIWIHSKRRLPNGSALAILFQAAIVGGIAAISLFVRR